ncbi:MAG: SAM-dependent methyltransferase [Bacteroidota bacterium]
MSSVHDTPTENNYWASRYREARTGWDIGYPSTPIKTYIDQLENKDLSILIPGAGNAYEAEYLFRNGFSGVHILDIALDPLENFKARVGDFPNDQLIHANFFEHQGQYDLIIEQTFFCSFPPTQVNRMAYAAKVAALLGDGGKLVGLWFDMPLTGDMEKRPFGGSKEEYLGYFEPYFKVKSFDKAYNSIAPRAGNELFGILEKK